MAYFLSIKDGVETVVAKYSFFVAIPTINLPLLSMKISYPVPCDDNKLNNVDIKLVKIIAAADAMEKVT